MRIDRTACLALLALLSVLASPSAAGDREIQEKARAVAVERGVSWLRKHQEPDGSFHANVGYKMGEGYVVTKADTPHLGVTALAGLALLHGPAGDDPEAHRKSLKKALDFVLSCRDEDGMFFKNGTRMYSHAFATYFLAEAFRVTGEERLKSPLRSALFATCKTQGRLGGWGYAPWDREVDITQTACQLLALQAGRRAGIEVPEKTLHRALAYVIASANTDPNDRENGGFGYEYRPRRENLTRSSFSTCAAGLASLLSAGLTSNEKIRTYVQVRGLKRPGWQKSPPEVGASIGYLENRYGSVRVNTYFYYFGNLFASQAIRAVGGEPWKRYRDRVSRDLRGSQRPDGSWPVIRIGDAYGTASACLILSELELPIVPLGKD